MANQELGYSPHTIRKYKSISEQELEEAFRDTIKVSNFDIKNRNSIKTISYDQTEILSWIMRLYNNGQPFDCDLTASKCIFFWKSLPKPEYLFDVNPQIDGVKHLAEVDNLNDCFFNSVVFDLPFLVSTGAMSKIKERFTYYESVDEIFRANDEMLERSYRLLKEQGLELDWSCVVWDGDFRYTPDGWSHHSFCGDKWQHINKPERKAFQKNAYRVLLTRARQGMVLVAPVRALYCTALFLFV